MKPYEYMKQLRQDYIDQINEFFEKNDTILTISINDCPEDLGTEIDLVSRDGTVTLIDEFNNDNEVELIYQDIVTISFILTSIINKNYEVYEHI